MCIAILKLKDSTITDEQLRASFRRNNDGGGIAYTVNNQLIVEKGYFNEDEFVQAVRRAEAVAESNMLIHCRIGTSGGRNAKNCHPFKVSDNVALIHNGIISKFNGKEADNSDTAIYVRDILSKISDNDLIYNESIKYLVEQDIGCGNKFILMNNVGDYTIFNEKSGYWDNGVWFSNKTYEPIKTYEPTTWAINCNSDFGKGYNTDKISYFKPKNFKSLLRESERREVKNMIEKLSDEQILEIGELPVIEFSNGITTISDNYMNGDYLMDLDVDLYDSYLERLSTIIMSEIDDLSDFQMLELGSSPYLSLDNAKVELTWDNKACPQALKLEEYTEIPEVYEMYSEKYYDLLDRITSTDKLTPNTPEYELLYNMATQAIDDLELDDIEWFDLRDDNLYLDLDTRTIESKGDISLDEISDKLVEHYKKHVDNLAVSIYQEWGI